MPEEVKIIQTALVVAFILIIAVLIFNAMTPVVATLPSSSQQQVQGIQNEFWEMAALVVAAGIIGVVVLIAKKLS
jgi:NO-binding membrane sensor protein with MHYT domain